MCYGINRLQACVYTNSHTHLPNYFLYDWAVQFDGTFEGVRQQKCLPLLISKCRSNFINVNCSTSAFTRTRTRKQPVLTILFNMILNIKVLLVLGGDK